MQTAGLEVSSAVEYRAWFQCIANCAGQYSLKNIIYRCPKCGNLLEVHHDLQRLRHHPPDYWKALFDRRFLRNEWPYGSSVWGKREMVCPEVEDDNIVSTFEGGSNLFWAERLGKAIGVPDLWVKQCGNSHTGSFKDLGMTVLISMVHQMIAEGQQIPAVACASTGDTSAALAAYCAVAGLQAIVFLPRDKISMAQLIQPIAHGALTLSLDTDFDGCMALVQEVCTRNNIYLANSMNSLRVEGQKTISIELTQQFDWEVPDWIIIPGGNLGNVSALGKGFLLMRDLGMITKLPRIACAQAERANPLYLSSLTGFQDFHPIQAQPTLASAIQIGNPVSVQKAIATLQTFDGVVEQASEDELVDAVARADRTGLFSCPHTGVALAVLFKLVERGTIAPHDRVVVISTANGLKFPEFKIKYHQSQLQDVQSRYANLPVDLPADYDRVREVILRTLDRRQE